MSFHLAQSDPEFREWLMLAPTEDELRDAYVALETERANLWRSGHIDSYRRDRFERDSVLVVRLVEVKWALARRWQATGQFDRFIEARQPA